MPRPHRFVGIGFLAAVVAGGTAVRLSTPDDGPRFTRAVEVAVRSVTDAVRQASASAHPRDPFEWPFASTSPWNTPIGSGARFAGPNDPMTAALHAEAPYVNAAAYSFPVYLAGPGDPLTTVSSTHETTRIRMPAVTRAAPGTDAAWIVVDPARQWVDEAWLARRTATGWRAGETARNALTGSGVDDGTRAAGVSALGGLIRAWELQARSIRHALAFALDGRQIRRGWVWPANREDGDSKTSYRGPIPMGTLVAIPPEVDVTALGLSPAGTAVARALQDYGAYLVDKGGGGFLLYSEPSSQPSDVDALRADVASILSTLRPVLNNGPASVGGGGTPRVPVAPPIATP